MRKRRRDTGARGLFAALLLIAAALAWFYFHDETAPADAGPVEGTLTVTMLDVGQGDAILLQCGGAAMLIDAGDNRTAAELVPRLRALGVEALDIVVATHPHADHIGGMDAVIDAFAIDLFIIPAFQANTKTFEEMLDAADARGLSFTEPEPGVQYALGTASVTILGPVKAYSDANNVSVVLRVDFGQTSFLFTGDQEARAERDLLASGARLAVDVLKVGHHGSGTSSTTAFIEAAAPLYALISCGTDNSYGHPHADTLETLAAAGVTVYRTDLQGDITAISDGITVDIVA